MRKDNKKMKNIIFKSSFLKGGKCTSFTYFR